MGIDIRGPKNELRKKYRRIREAFSPEEKRRRDSLIFENLIHMCEVNQADTVVCFISTLVEVDTHRLIHYCWRHQKNVVVPKCLNDRGKMKFYYLRSWNDVEIGRFSLLEPNPQKCREFTQWERSVCIVPGFCFDTDGYRLGFGRGFYDRFLSKYSEIKIGICYNNCISPKLPHGRYDVAVNYLVTEDKVQKIDRMK